MPASQIIFSNDRHEHKARCRLLRWPLDYVFVDERFSLVDLQRLPIEGSDHFPIVAELCYQPSVAAEQEAPEANADDRSEAQERIVEGHAKERKEDFEPDSAVPDAEVTESGSP